MARKAKDYSRPHPIRAILCIVLGIFCGHAFRIAMINRDGVEAVHGQEFILTVALSIIGGVVVIWMSLNSKRPGLLAVPLGIIAFGIAACVW